VTDFDSPAFEMAAVLMAAFSAIHFYFVGIVRAGGRTADIDLAVGWR